MRKLLQVLSLVTIMLGTTLSATPLSAADAAVDKNRKQARRNAASTTIATELETSSAPQVIIPMSDSAQRVVTYLAGVGGANWCYAGTIASNTGVPKNSVAAVLTGLLAKGWAEEVETEETFMNPNTKR